MYVGSHVKQFINLIPTWPQQKIKIYQKMSV